MEKLLRKSNSGPVAGLLADRRGATAVEYGLLVALISIALILPLTAIGNNLSTIYDLISTAMGQ